MLKTKLLLVFVVLSTLVACDGSSSDDGDAENDDFADLSGVGLPVPNNQFLEHYSVLFMGNSHSAGMPNILTKLITASLPGKTTSNKQSPRFMFLDERLTNEESQKYFTQGTWSHVVLQGQKYSQSNSFVYPTVETQTWIAKTKAKSATPILFPEHPQVRDINEGIRVYDLHQQISQKESSCVAPIGHVWKKIMRVHPDINLFMADGNHANHAGQFLTAMVFYEIVTGNEAELLPYVEYADVTFEQQAVFRPIVTDTLKAFPACSF